MTCGIAIDQTVHCWGDYTEKHVPGLYSQLAGGGGGGFVCGLLISGKINCWGTYWLPVHKRFNCYAVVLTLNKDNFVNECRSYNCILISVFSMDIL
jgi:hypothetical protein